MPVDLVAGQRDEKFSALARKMATRISHARVTIVPGVGHAAHLEAPAEIAAVIVGPEDPGPAQAATRLGERAARAPGDFAP
jgi:pimeloyl-ACP methyl ester carboxylesterase